MNEDLEREPFKGLLAALMPRAEEITRSVLWPGDEMQGGRLLEAIRGLDGDWAGCLPDELVAVWDRVSDETKVAAFLLAARQSLRVEC